MAWDFGQVLLLLFEISIWVFTKLFVKFLRDFSPYLDSILKLLQKASGSMPVSAAAESASLHVAQF